MKWILAGALGVVALAWCASVWLTAQPFAGTRRIALTVSAEPGRVESTVKTLVQQFPHRHGGNPDQLLAAGAWLEGELRELGLSPTRDPVGVRGVEHFNLLTSVGPTTGDTVVVGAHYDAHPETAGADDNASGVAAALEVARLLAATPPPCPVVVALWTLEEPPFFRTADMGSARHALRLKRDSTPLRAAFSLEMLGYYRDGPGTQRYPPRFVASPAYPSSGNFALLMGDTSSTALTRRLKAAFAGTSTLPIESVNVSRSFAGADFSDHLNFWNAGFTAFMLTDSAFLRNPNYHRASDTPETLDYARLAAAATGVAAMAIAACEP